MIKIKNSILNQDTIESLNNLLDLDIKATEAFKLMRILKELSSIIEDKTKLEKKIFDKYVEKDDEGNPVKAIDENGNEIPNAVKITDSASFNKEMEDLYSYENEISYELLNFEDLNLKSNLKIKDLIKIDFLFK